MSERHPDFRLSPRPPLRKTERGGALVAVLLIATVSCRPTPPAASTGGAATAVSVEDTLLVDSNPIRTAFLDRYVGLERMGDGWGVLLYPKNRARLIGKLRSDLPEGHPLRFVEGLDMEGRVYAIIAVPGMGTDSVYVIHTDGPSGDPGFYFADGQTGATGDVIWGEILAVPDSGPIMMYQRTNTNFPVVKEVRMSNGYFEEVPVARWEIGLRTIVLDTIKLWRSPKDSSIVATLVPGDSVVVVAAVGRVYGNGTPLLIQSSSGALGWTLRGGDQCYSMSIRGICFLGD
jgi:hypothetical protein